jgi:hypothetical protein
VPIIYYNYTKQCTIMTHKPINTLGIKCCKIGQAADHEVQWSCPWA